MGTVKDNPVSLGFKLFSRTVNKFLLLLGFEFDRNREKAPSFTQRLQGPGLQSGSTLPANWHLFCWGTQSHQLTLLLTLLQHGMELHNLTFPFHHKMKVA